MPKKTKKEKLRAQHHRQATLPAPFVLPSLVNRSSETIIDSQRIKRDLTKTLVLASLIVAIELALTKWLP